MFDPSQLVMCTPGQAGMRNQNIYSTRVTTGLIASMLGNTKPLGIVAGQADPAHVRRHRGEPGRDAQVDRAAHSVAAGRRTRVLPAIRAAGRSAGDHRGKVEHLARGVRHLDRSDGVGRDHDRGRGDALRPRRSLLINPDITNPDIQNPDIQNPDIQNPDIQNAEVHAVTVSNPDIQNPDIQNPDIQNPDIQNPDIQNPDIQNPDIQNLAFANPDIINPDIQNPDIQNPDIQNPDIQNPDIQNPDIQNRSLTDVTWNVNNIGNTATAYQVKVLLDQAAQARLLAAGVQFQLVITKTTKVPVVIDQCLVAQPGQNITVASINNPAFTDPAEPGGSSRRWSTPTSRTPTSRTRRWRSRLATPRASRSGSSARPATPAVPAAARPAPLTRSLPARSRT